MSCEYRADRYEGCCIFTVEWKGVKEFIVEMHKSVDILLEKANRQAEENAWNEVQLNCQRILELDKENTAAKKLKEKADLELATNLKIKALIGTEEVNADITGANLEHEYKSIELIKYLNYREEYMIKLTYYANNGEIYEGSYTFVADWKGIKEIPVEMHISKTAKEKKEIEDILNRTRNYAARGLWFTVLYNSIKILKLDPNNEDAQFYYNQAKAHGASEKTLKVLMQFQ